jgi:membrane-bound lytic murein transglycosylase D
MGMWQFIPSTGKTYKLDQNWWVDERRDIIASTTAALDYLQNIYEMHGDWHLALASYNWGEHAVARAIAKNQAKGLPTDYASLTMPAETRYYVPKLQALKNIVANPEVFDFRLPPLSNQPYFEAVTKPEREMVTKPEHEVVTKPEHEMVTKLEHEMEIAALRATLRQQIDAELRADAERDTVNSMPFHAALFL